MTEIMNHRCGDCVNMRADDGYCGRLGRYVNYFRVACKDYADRIEAAEKEAIDSMPEPEEPAVRVNPERATAAKMRRRAEKEPGTEKTCKNCGRTLPLEQFAKHAKSRDGHSCTCQECYSKKMSDTRKAYWATQPHKEKPVPEDLPEGQKRCTRCGRVLPVEAFGKHPSTHDHLHPHCLECRKEEGRAAYERNCEKRGVTPKPPKDSQPEQKETTKTIRELTDLELVEELRYRGWTVTCIKTI